MLEINDLHVHYGAIHALHGINVRVEQGQIVTEDGRQVEGLSDSDSVPNRNLHRTEQDTVTADPPHQSATPGELE